MKKSKTLRIFFAALLVILIASAAYNLFDNQRVIVVEQEITLERLPASFDGFKILLVADLHGRTFGENQARLANQINSQDYDMLALAGDMNPSFAGNSLAEAQPILDLLDAVENKEYAFWVDGNTGPQAMVDYGNIFTGELTEVGAQLEQKGVRMLNLPAPIMRGSDRIWIVPEMSELLFDISYRSVPPDQWFFQPGDYERSQQFYQTAYAAYLDILNNGEAKILLLHNPKQTDLSAEELASYQAGELDYDLILSGHYHGGQFRLPLIGALYIPSPTTGINNSGIFPDQTSVKGISYYGNVPQYVSAGLGASASLRLLAFRLFNTPEINLITLRSGK